MRGASYQCSNAIIEKTVVLPGEDTPYLSTDPCSIAGVGHRDENKLRLDQAMLTLRSEDKSRMDQAMLTLRSQDKSRLDDATRILRAEFDSELTAKISDVQHEQNAARRRERLVYAIIAIFLLAAFGYKEMTRFKR